MSQKRSPFDNATVESLPGALKSEAVYPSLDNLGPNEFEQMLSETPSERARLL